MFQFFRVFFFCFTLISSLEAFSLKEINGMVSDLSNQHVEKKKIDKELFKESLSKFIDDFDPQKVYLLEEEVSPYLHPSPYLLERMDKSYKNQDFTPYKELLQVIQKAIRRSREIRKKIELQEKIVQMAQKGNYEADKRYPIFSKKQLELEERIKNELFGFIQEEGFKFGFKAVTNSELVVLDGYEEGIRRKEAPYLCESAEGVPYSKEKEENCFATQIMKSLAQSLDPHSDFFDTEEADKMKERLEHKAQSLGITIEKRANGFFISNIDPSGMASSQGGIKKGDQLLKISGKSLIGLQKEAVDKLLADFQEGALLIQRGEDQREVSISDAEGESEAAGFYQEEKGGVIGLIVLDSFYDGTKGGGKGNESSLDVANAIKELKKKGDLQGLILDLRENGGGFLNQGVKIAGLFITNGVIVISKYFDNTETVYRDTDPSDLYDGPFVVLISKETASAAEVVAGAIKDYGVGLIVGDERTYGKGTIQNQTITSGKEGGYFKVTVGRYYTVSGKTPQIDGVLADIVVPGPYHFQRIGEQFLEGSLQSKGKDKQIESFYNDTLTDVIPAQKEWYLHYYATTLQKKEEVLAPFLPTLRKKSEERLKGNSLYQDFLSKKISWDEFVDAVTKNGEKTPWISVKNKTDKMPSDPQLDEAIRILQDLKVLEKK